jgi:hypothetical protein
MTQADEIRELLRAGWTSPAITHELGCSRQAVAAVRARMQAAKPVGRPRKPRCEHCGVVYVERLTKAEAEARIAEIDALPPSDGYARQPIKRESSGQS